MGRRDRRQQPGCQKAGPRVSSDPGQFPGHLLAKGLEATEFGRRQVAG